MICAGESMTIQDDPDLLDYVSAKLHPLAPRPGSFLELFLHCCMRADSHNYPHLRDFLLICVQKYPADADRLEMERRDRGGD